MLCFNIPLLNSLSAKEKGEKREEKKKTNKQTNKKKKKNNITYLKQEL